MTDDKPNTGVVRINMATLDEAEREREKYLARLPASNDLRIVAEASSSWLSFLVRKGIEKIREDSVHA